jgi:UDP-N-acetyl-D-galactosamine dehydrogenase
VPEEALKPAAAIILAVGHAAYRKRGWQLIRHRLAGGKGLVLDLKACLSRTERPDNIELWRL